MKTSSAYWQKRFQAVEAMNNQTAKGTVQAITPAFDQAQAQIEKEINAWYARFAKNNQISLLEAKKILNTRELKEFRWDVNEYIKHGRQNALDQAWMKQLENASARFHISRLEALKVRTQQAAEMAFGNELDLLDEAAARIYTDGYYHTAYEIQRGLGIGWDIGQIDQNKLRKILDKPWTADKMTFSDRIWKSKTQLIDSLHKELTQMCVLGKAPDQTISAIAKRMNVSRGQAGRLVMTEAAYFGSAAQKDCFNELDVEKFEIVATLDSHTSDICQDMDGKVFDMKDFQAGVTAPPFHVWCRSCTAPWFEDNDDGTRAARGADGKTYQVPASMKYEDWKNSFVDGGSKDGLKAIDDKLRDELIESIRSKKIWDGLSEEKRDIIIAELKNGDPHFVQMAERCMDKCSVTWEIDTEGTAHYTYGTGHITMTRQDGDKDLAQTFWHEYGHYLDDVSTSGSGVKYVTKTVDRKGNVSEWVHNGASAVSREIGYEDATRKDINRLLDDLGLSDKYYIPDPQSEYDHPWIFKKATGEALDLDEDWEDMDVLMNALNKKFNDISGVTDANNYLKNLGYPQQPKYEDYFEWYRTPKRQTLKKRPKFKGAEDAWYEALEKADKAQEVFMQTHDMDAIFAEERRLKAEAQAKLAKLGWVSDTIDGSVYGAFKTVISLGGHTSKYYLYNANGIKEGVANVFMANATGDPDVLNVFEEICPELFKVMTGAWKHD